MMKMLDVIRRLESLVECSEDFYLTSLQYGEEDEEALRTAISALEGLERNRAKAENAVKAMQICFGLAQWEEACPKCPYYDSIVPGSVMCAVALAQDIERLLTLAYLQGGGDDEQS